MKSLTNVILKNSKRKDEKIGATKKEKALSAFSFGIVFVFLALFMTIISFIVTKKLEEIEQTYAFVNILLLMNFFILYIDYNWNLSRFKFFNKQCITIFDFCIRCCNSYKYCYKRICR